MLQPFELGPHLDPELGIEIGQRLVEQEQGVLMIARASATRWRWPPDSSRGSRVSSACSSTRRATSSTRLLSSAAGTLRIISG